MLLCGTCRWTVSPAYICMYGQVVKLPTSNRGCLRRSTVYRATQTLIVERMPAGTSPSKGRPLEASQLRSRAFLVFRLAEVLERNDMATQIVPRLAGVESAGHFIGHRWNILAAAIAGTSVFACSSRNLRRILPCGHARAPFVARIARGRSPISPACSSYRQTIGP